MGVIDNRLETHHPHIPKCQSITHYSPQYKDFIYTQNTKVESAMLTSLNLLSDYKDVKPKIMICQISKSNNKPTLMKVSNYCYELHELHRNACTSYA